MGFQALLQNTVSQNTAVGAFALEIDGTGANNTAVGYRALRGSNASNNTAVGHGALDLTFSGSGNTALGFDAGSTLTGSDSDNIMIGNVGILGDNDYIRLGTDATHIKTFIAGNIFTKQPDITVFSDGDEDVTTAQLLTRIMTCALTADRTWTLPTAAIMVGDILNVANDDSFDFNIINQGGMNDDILLAAGVGGNIVGVAVTEGATAGNNSESGWRLRFVDVSGGNEAYTVYRLS